MGLITPFVKTHVCTSLPSNKTSTLNEARNSGKSPRLWVPSMLSLPFFDDEKGAENGQNGAAENGEDFAAFEP